MPWIRNIGKAARVLVSVALLVPATFALASSGRPLPPSGIYAVSPVPHDPAPAPVSNLMPDTQLYNQLVKEQPEMDETEATGETIEAGPIDGPGILDRSSSVARGNTLFKSDSACLTFDDEGQWNGKIWYASYGGWGTFSVDDGGFYKPEHVRFDMERTVGPGARGGSEFSFKISGSNPYAAGLVSPVLSVPAGSVVEVRVMYMLFNQSGVNVGSRNVNDWVSLGLKPDAHGDDAVYVNGYTRGQWTQLANSVVADSNGEVLVLIQAESPAALNSNVYFDDIEVLVDGMALDSCG